MRKALEGLGRYIATVETSKHKPFVFLPLNVGPDHKLYVIASEDAFILGTLSSRIHAVWALVAGGTLEDRPTWTNTTCFRPFPFPDCDEDRKRRIREIAEALDAHRKRVQAQDPDLTLTGMYNVLEKLRANEQLSDKEKRIHEQALVSVLRQLHDDLDTAVFAAYGWPSTLTDAEILERLVALNAERAKEEASGVIRWLRPEYQNPNGTQQAQAPLALAPGGDHDPAPAANTDGKAPWPKTLSERVKAVALALSSCREPVTSETLARHFLRARTSDVSEILETLCTMGHAHRGKSDGTYLP